jgi:hypothetical protein
MTFPVTTLHPAVAMLALFQGTQLSLFERFLTQALSGIDSTSITSGMQNVAYVVLLVGFLWQVYQSALHGGDVRGLGTSLIKYVATAFIIMNYSAVFSTVNQGFVNAGNWIGNASGAGNLFDNWKNDIQTQFNQDASQQLWSLISGGLPGLIDGLLIIVAYILYPVVIAIFGFFYIFYGSVLYIFGPIVIALLPHPAGSRIAKSYIENVFIWNAWPILYGGFGALLSAVQMGQVGQMLNQNDFLGALGNVEGSFLIGIASIIYSLAIAVIPFIAKRIVSGDVGSTAAALVGAAATALTAGAAAIEGVGVGMAAGGSGATGIASTSPAATQAGTSGARATSAASGNQPAPSQRGPERSPSQSGSNTAPSSARPSNAPGSPQTAPSTDALSEGTSGSPSVSSLSDSSSPTAEAHADFMRDHLGAAFSEEPANDTGSRTSGESQAGSSSGHAGARAGGAPGRSGASGSGRGPSRPTVRRYDVGTWGAFHAARLATQTVVGGGRAAAGAISSATDSISNPIETAGRMGASAGRVAGTVANAASSVGQAASSVTRAVSNPGQTAQKGKQAVSEAVTGAAHRVARSARQTVDAATTQFSEGYGAARSRNDANSDGADEE